VRLGEWVEVRVSRTGRLASLEVEDDPAQEILAPGAFTQLSLPLNLYLGGAPSSDMYSPKMKTTASFVGCIQTIVLNNREVRTLGLYRPARSYAVDNATAGALLGVRVLPVWRIRRRNSHPNYSWIWIPSSVLEFSTEEKPESRRRGRSLARIYLYSQGEKLILLLLACTYQKNHK